MDKKMSRDTLIKSILYEANQLEIITSKIKPGERHHLDYHTRVINQLADFYVDTASFWKYEVEIPSIRNPGQKDEQYPMMLNWLKENNVAYIHKTEHNIENSYHHHVFKFINEDDAAAFKLRFTE